MVDQALCAWAASNSRQQASRGLGHFVMAPGAAQCAGVGYATPEAAIMGWYYSPGHRAIVLDPRARYIGLAWSGSAHTLNVRR
jgi:uncharacterized protein YkwD